MSDLGSVLGIGLAFLGGILSFASPCCLPLVPAYISYMVGATGEGTAGRRPAFFHGLAFVTGFSLVFVGFFVALGALGAFIDRQILNVIGGGLLVLMGLQVAGAINIRALWRDTRAMPTMGGGLVMAGGPGSGGFAAGGSTPAYPRSFAFGLLFAAGWSPCIGPILGGILGLATATFLRRPGHGPPCCLRGRAGNSVPRRRAGRLVAVSPPDVGHSPPPPPSA